MKHAITKGVENERPIFVLRQKMYLCWAIKMQQTIRYKKHTRIKWSQNKVGVIP